MRRAVVRLFFLSAPIFGGYAGCSAHGNDVPPSYGEADTGPRKVIGDDPNSVTGTASGDGGGASSDGGKPKTDGGGTTTDDAGALTPCGFVTSSPGGTCTAATDIGSVSGDTDATINTIKFTGKGSQWVVLTVTEDSSSVSRHDLSVGFKLTSASGTNYDLFAYVDPSGSKTTQPCTNVTNQSTNASTPDEVRLLWTDSNFSSDTRLVSVRVEHVSGPCSGGDEWTLDVLGHAP